MKIEEKHRRRCIIKQKPEVVPGRGKGQRKRHENKGNRQQ
jgi:hypothetical protein